MTLLAKNQVPICLLHWVTNFRVGSVNGVLFDFSNVKWATEYEYDLRFPKITLSREIITFSGIPDFRPDRFTKYASKIDIFSKLIIFADVMAYKHINGHTCVRVL